MTAQALCRVGIATIGEALEPRLREKTRAALRRGGLFALGEAYRRGDILCDDPAPLVHYALDHPELLPGKLNPRWIAHLAYELLTNSQRGDGVFEVGRRHYDLGNDLFQAMLDPSLSYTCAMWQGAHTLYEAQINKLDHICKKLALAPGMRVLDIGCGWGNFAYYAAQRYGVSVTGLTISKEQAAFAQERCKNLPVTILLQDYQNFRGHFDRVVSIEMIEAAGRQNISSFFSAVSRCLEDSGRFLLQVISAETFNRSSVTAVDQFVLWLVKHIFPNGYLPKIRELSDQSSRGFAIDNIENIAADYEHTLNAWRDNFNRAWPTLQGRYDETFRRTWLFYLSGCAAFFQRRLAQTYQILYAKRAGVRSLEKF